MNGKEFLDKILNEENNYYIGDGITASCYFENGMLPHFHFYSKRVRGCIRLDIPKYFCHNPSHDGLNSGEKKTIIYWLEEESGWEEMANLWNKSATVKINTEVMPDYNLLPNLNSTTGKLNKEDRR